MRQVVKDFVTICSFASYALLKRGTVAFVKINNRIQEQLMELIRVKRTLSACCLLASGFTALAGPLQRADLPAEPVWVVHVDVDGLRPTTIGQFIFGEMEKPEAQAKLA